MEAHFASSICPSKTPIFNWFGHPNLLICTDPTTRLKDPSQEPSMQHRCF